MGRTVLNPGISPAPALRRSGGVALLAINTDRTASHSLKLPTASDSYTLTAPNLGDTRIDLNGKELRLSGSDELPVLAGVPTPAGPVPFEPASITFLAIPDANSARCR